MPAYHYIALNQEQKELSGIIEAPDESEARKKLNDLALSIVSLTETALPNSDQKNKFEFEGLDKGNKKVVGTIVADAPLKAYIRLFEEYQLNIVALISAGKAVDLAALQQEYEKSSDARKKVATAGQAPSQQEIERKELLQKVDFTMGKVQVFLQTYGADLKTEERDTIQSYINQLMRIKDSTNLEHIRMTCQKMLDHLQKEELFLHEEQKMAESTKIKVDTKELLSQLKRTGTGLQKDIDVIGALKRFQENPFLKPIVNFLLSFSKEDSPEVKKLRGELSAANRNLWEYAKLSVLGKSQEVRAEARKTLRTMIAERKRLKANIHALVMQEQAGNQEEKQPDLFWENTGKLFGWVLAFYLASYIVSYPFTVKQFGAVSVPKTAFFYSSHFLKSLTLFLFLGYGAITIHTFWLKKKIFVSYALFPLTLFGFLLILINLM